MIARIDIAYGRVHVPLRFRSWGVTRSLSVLLGGWSKGIPAQSQVQTQIRSDANIILNVKTARPILPDSILAAALLEAVRAAEEEIGHRVARTGCGAASKGEITDLPQRIVVFDVHAQQLAAEVDLVPVMDPMQAVVELQRVAINLGRAAALNGEVSSHAEPQLFDIRGRCYIGAEIRDAERGAAEQVGVVAIVGSGKAVE